MKDTQRNTQNAGLNVDLFIKSDHKKKKAVTPLFKRKSGKRGVRVIIYNQ